MRKPFFGPTIFGGRSPPITAHRPAQFNQPTIHWQSIRPSRPLLHESIRLNSFTPTLKPLAMAMLQYAIVFVAIYIGGLQTANAQLFKSWGQPATSIPTAFNGVPTQQQLLNHLARQTASVKQVDASVSVAMDGAPKLKGTLQIERPLRLRLKAGVLGVDQMGVDVGSNNDLFWIWTRVPIPGQPPTLMFANHEQFKRSGGAVRQAIPLEPSWLISALGLVDFSPNDFHQGPTLTPQGRLKLVTVNNAPAGRQYRISIIDANSGLIEQQSIYDQNRNLVAYTNSTRYKFYPQHNVSLPNRVDMHLFTDGQEQKLTITTTGFNINSLFGDPNRMWKMPQPANVQRIDLSQVGGAPASPPPPARALPVVQSPRGSSNAGSATRGPTMSSPQPTYRPASTPSRPPSSSPSSSPSSPRTYQPRTRLSPLK